MSTALSSPRSSTTRGRRRLACSGVVLMLLSIRAYRGDRCRSAGGFAGLAAAMKLLPGVLIGWFVLRRSRAAAVWGVLALLLFALVLPGLVTGPSLLARSYAHWWSAVAEPYALGGQALLERHAYLPGQSLSAVTYRWFAGLESKRGTPAGTLHARACMPAT